MYVCCICAQASTPMKSVRPPVPTTSKTSSLGRRTCSRAARSHLSLVGPLRLPVLVLAAALLLPQCSRSFRAGRKLPTRTLSSPTPTRYAPSRPALRTRGTHGRACSLLPEHSPGAPTIRRACFVVFSCPHLPWCSSPKLGADARNKTGH